MSIDQDYRRLRAIANRLISSAGLAETIDCVLYGPGHKARKEFFREDRQDGFYLLALVDPGGTLYRAEHWDGEELKYYSPAFRSGWEAAIALAHTIGVVYGGA